METESLLQFGLALLAVIPGTLALIVQYRKNKADAKTAARDDSREDFTALFEAAKQLGDAGTALVGPLTETIEKLRAEMVKREKDHREDLQELEMRLAAMERKVEELSEINVKLMDANQRYEGFFKWLRGELSRLSTVDPTRFPRERGTPDFIRETKE